MEKEPAKTKAEKEPAKKNTEKESAKKNTGKESGKAKALENALAQIDKKYGKGAVMKLGDVAKNMEISVISTGCLELDIALGVGGIPRGRIVEIYGPESSGKTTLSLHMIAEAQKQGGAVAFVDVEHALDPSYAKALGVDIDNLYVSQPGTGEEALEIVEALVSSGGVDMIVIDSVAALVPKVEIDGLMSESQVGLQARLMSKALRKLAGVISKTGTIAVFINQLREKVGVMFGSPETTSGGRALKFYATIRLDIRRSGQIKVGEQIVGNQTKVKVVKNKVAPPFKTAEVEIYYGEGISVTASTLNMATDLDIITKSGSWFSYKGSHIGQGRDNARKYLKENPEIMEEIRVQIYKHHKVGEFAESAREKAEDKKAEDKIEGDSEIVSSEIEPED